MGRVWLAELFTHPERCYVRKRSIALFLIYVFFSLAHLDDAISDTKFADSTSFSRFSEERCLPFSMPVSEALYRSKRIVFAHFFGAIFPISFDNLPPRLDFYNREWLVPRGRWAGQGGFLRSRPLGVEPGNARTSRQTNLEREVRQAIARGITGFTYEFHKIECGNLAGSVSGCVAHLRQLLKAVEAVDPRFKIALMIGGMSIEDAKTAIKTIYDEPNMYRIDGRLVVAPFQANILSPAQWGQLTSDLKTEGFPIFFMPTFLSLSQGRVDSYGAVSDGIGTFASATMGQAAAITKDAAFVHRKRLPFMAGVSPQNYKPKEFTYFESTASRSFREAWEAAIAANVEYIQLTTWNDFSETTQIAPYTDGTLAPNIGTGFYNLNAYYAVWYLTGEKPKIERDILTYFYRRQSTKSPTPLAAQPTLPSTYSTAGVDVIELLGYLTSPGTLSITTTDGIATLDAPAGLTSFQIPLIVGRPQFSLTRKGQTLITISGGVDSVGTAATPSGFADLTYWSGTASAAGECTIP